MLTKKVNIMKDKQEAMAAIEHFDAVYYPKHYTTHPEGIECIQVTRHMNFNLGNAVKYLWRAGKKENTVQDLEKAIWYIRDEIGRITKEGKWKDVIGVGLDGELLREKKGKYEY